MELVAELVGQAVVGGTVERLVSAQGHRVLLVQDGAYLRAYGLERLLSGDNQPVVTFVGGWWREYEWCWAVAPDLGTVVVCQADGVVALDPSGAQRWRFAHAPWWKASAGGGVCVSADGLHCWAVVPVGDQGGPERWVVLRVSDGTLVATAGLSSQENEMALHLDIPRGGQVMVNPNMGQDGAYLCVGHVDDVGTLHVSEVPRLSDVVLLAVHPRGESMVVADRPPRSLFVLRVPGGEQVIRFSIGDMLDELDDEDEDEELRWSIDGGALPGYLDDARLLASCADDYGDGPRTLWLFDVPAESPAARTGRHEVSGPVDGSVRYGIRGPVAYGVYGPAGTDQVWPLGDGTWLTVDGAILRRWALD